MLALPIVPRYYEFMSKSPNDLPFITLGNQLKVMRQNKKQSLAEVSGAVEIDIEDLNKMETGIERPSEDVLMLLINYFDVKDDEALGLWQLAGYDRPLDNQYMAIDGDQQRSVVVMLALDSRIVYSDDVNVDTSNKGVVLNFTQQSGVGNNGSIPIARVGMSKDQAEDVLAKLQEALLRIRFQTRQKLLSDPGQVNDKKPESV